MAEITLNKADAQHVLADPNSSPDARVISGLALAYFEVKDHAPVADKSTLSIARKLVHMCSVEIEEACDALSSEGEG